jgi:hypothetical protein
MRVQRLRRAIVRYGVQGAVRAAWGRLWGHVFLCEHHLWYAMDLAEIRPRRELAAGLTLRRGGEFDLDLLERLPTVSTERARLRLARQHALWLVLDGEQPLFACWIFRGETPVIAAPGGEMSLANGTVCLEDSVTAAAARGRGVAPGAWTSIAEGLARDGVRQLITKVEMQNIASRRAVEKVGFRPVALMHFLRIGPGKRTRVDVLELDRGAEIATRLESH